MRRAWIVLAAAAVMTLVVAAMGSAQGYGKTYGTQSAAGVMQEIATATAHARNAAGSEARGGATGHLWHVINCLQGPKGKDYNRGEANPCQGQGNGILADLRETRGGAAFMLVASAANSLAQAGVEAKDLDSARNAAAGVAALLATIRPK